MCVSEVYCFQQWIGPESEGIVSAVGGHRSGTHDAPQSYLHLLQVISLLQCSSLVGWLTMAVEKDIRARHFFPFNPLSTLTQQLFAD